MAHFEAAMDIGQKFWTIRAVVVYRSGKKTIVRTIEEHSVAQICIYGEDKIGYVYDISGGECYAQCFEEDIGTEVFLSEADAKLAMDRIEAAEK